MNESQLYAEHLREWHKWRWRAVVAFVALGLANAYGFWTITQERQDRIDQAATMILVRCKDSRANRLAIRRIVRFEASEQEHKPHVPQILAILRSLPPVQNCQAQADAIRDLVD